MTAPGMAMGYWSWTDDSGAAPDAGLASHHQTRYWKDLRGLVWLLLLLEYWRNNAGI